MKCDYCGADLDSKHISVFRFVVSDKEEIGWCLCYCCANRINNLLLNSFKESLKK